MTVGFGSILALRSEPESGLIRPSAGYGRDKPTPGGSERGGQSAFTARLHAADGSTIPPRRPAVGLDIG
jgi:hypothetical protein